MMGAGMNLGPQERSLVLQVVRPQSPRIFLVKDLIRIE